MVKVDLNSDPLLLRYFICMLFMRLLDVDKNVSRKICNKISLSAIFKSLQTKEIKRRLYITSLVASLLVCLHRKLFIYFINSQSY